MAKPWSSIVDAENICLSFWMKKGLKSISDILGQAQMELGKN